MTCLFFHYLECASKWLGGKVQYTGVFSVRQIAGHVRILSLFPLLQCQGLIHILSDQCISFSWLSSAFQASRPHFLLLPLVPALESVAFSVLLSDTSALCACQPYIDSRVRRFVAVKLLVFHLQMKTTWPAAQVRWKPDGRSQEGALGSLEQHPSVMSSSHVPGPLQPLPIISSVHIVPGYRVFPLRPWPGEKKWPRT